MIASILKGISKGFLFGLGLLAVGVPALWLGEKLSVPKLDPKVVRYEKTTDLQFTDSTVVAASKVFSVAGKLINSGPFVWNDLEVDVDVYEDERLVRTCGDWLHDVRPGESRSFYLVCDDLNPSPGQAPGSEQLSWQNTN